MKRIYLIGLITSTLTLTTVACAWGQDVGQDRPVTVAFSDPSRPGMLKVNLLQGGITIKAYNGRDVVIQTRSRGSNSNRRPATDTQGLHRIDAASNGLIVEEASNVMTISSNTWNRSFDLDIQVPTRTNLQVKTVNGGGLVIEGVDGDIEANNDNGNVTLTDVSGSVVAHSMNGRVIAVLKRVTAQKPMSFATLNGNVDVTLPADVKANVKLRTDNGDVWTDFDIQVKAGPTPAAVDNRSRGGRYRIEVDKSILGTINGGGADFELRSMNGTFLSAK